MSGMAINPSSSLVPVSQPSKASKVAGIKKVEQTLDNVQDGANTVKSVVNAGNQAIETTSTAKKVAQGSFEPLAKLPPKFQKAAEGTSKFLTENKVVRALESTSIGKAVVANHAKLLEGTDKAFKVLAVAGGAIQIAKGVTQIADGKTYDGGWNVAKGGVLATSAFVSGPVGLGIVVGVEVAHYGDKATKEFGWFKDGAGKNESAIQHVGTKVSDTYKEVSAKNGRTAGVAASVIQAHGQTLVAATSIVAGAAIKGTQAVGDAAQKGGKKLQEAGNRMEAHAEKLKQQGGAKKVVAYGEIAVAKTSKAVGVALQSTGEALSHGAETAKKAVGSAIGYAERGVNNISTAVGNGVGKVTNAVSSATTSTVNYLKSWF